MNLNSFIAGLSDFFKQALLLRGRRPANLAAPRVRRVPMLSRTDRSADVDRAQETTRMYA